MLELYQNIKERRLALGMSQQELADELEYTSRSSIAKIEAGKSDIPQSKIQEFATALHTTPAYLMGWTDDPYDYNLDPDGRFDEIPQSTLETLIEQCRGDMERVWHTWEDIQNDNARQAAMDSLGYVETIKNPDIRLIARAGKKLSPEDAQKLLTVAKTLFPEAFDDT